MLRDVRSRFLKPRLLAIRYTTASNVVTINQGIGSFKATSASTGSAVCTWTRQFARRPIIVASASASDIANGGFVSGTANTFPTALGHTFLSVDSTATADDGTVKALILGYDSRDATAYSRRANVVRGEMDQSKIVALRIDTSGSASTTINARAVFSLTRNGTGDVTVKLRSAFANASFVPVGTAVSTTGQIVNTTVTASDTFRFEVFTNGGTTAADGIVNLIVVGDAQGNGERVAAGPLMSDQRKPLLFGYSVIYAGGVPGYDLNSGDATLTDTATGRTTFTFQQAFRREPIVVAMPIANTGVQCCTLRASSSSAIEVGQFSAANALADCTDTSGFQLIGIGFDDSNEF